MISLIKNIQKFLFKYRLLALGACLLLCIIMISAAFRLKLKEDIMDLLPLKDEAVSDYVDVLRAFQKSDRLVFMVQTKSDDTDKETLIAAADKLAAKLQNNKMIKQVYYKWDAWEVSEALAVLRTLRADLFDQEDAQKLADALINGKAIQIEGGNFELPQRRFRCGNDGHEWNVPFEAMAQRLPLSCPVCLSGNILELAACL